MANAVVARWDYAEGSSVSVTVQVESSWPDGLDEARRQAVKGLREATAEDTNADDDTLAHLDTDDDGES